MRAFIIEKMYECSSYFYIKYFRENNPWEITSEELHDYPTESLGFHLSCFHRKYNLKMMANLEEHDIIHVLTNTGVTVPDEVALQYFLLGNGKKGLFMRIALISGTIFYPEYLKTFKRYYDRGRSSHQFYDLDFKNMLIRPVTEIQYTFNIK